MTAPHGGPETQRHKMFERLGPKHRRVWSQGGMGTVLELIVPRERWRQCSSCGMSEGMIERMNALCAPTPTEGEVETETILARAIQEVDGRLTEAERRAVQGEYPVVRDGPECTGCKAPALCDDDCGDAYRATLAERCHPEDVGDNHHIVHGDPCTCAGDAETEDELGAEAAIEWDGDRSISSDWGPQGRTRCNLCVRVPCRCGVPAHFVRAYEALVEAYLARSTPEAGESEPTPPMAEKRSE